MSLRGWMAAGRRTLSGFLVFVMTAILILGNTQFTFAGEASERFFEEESSLTDGGGYSIATVSNAKFKNEEKQGLVISVFSEDSDFRAGGDVVLDVHIKNDTGSVISDGSLWARAKGSEADSAYFEEIEDSIVYAGDITGGDEESLIDDSADIELELDIDPAAEAAASSRKAQKAADAEPESLEDEDEEEKLEKITGIDLAPGEVYSARYHFVIAEGLEKTKNQAVKFYFTGEDEDEKKIHENEDFLYTVNYLNLDTVLFEESNRVYTGEEITMGIHSFMYDFDALLWDSFVDTVATPSDATPSDATPSNAAVATPSNAAVPYEYDEDSDTYIVDLEDTSYTIQMINARLNGFEVRKALVNDANENMLVCSYRVSKNVEPGIYFGKITQESKSGAKTFRSTQGFALIVEGDGEITLEGQVGDAIVTVTGPADSFPEADQLAIRVAEVDSDMQELVETAIQKRAEEDGFFVNAYRAFDIKLYADGEEVEPDGSLQVTFKNIEMEEKNLIVKAVETVAKTVSSAVKSVLSLFGVEETADAESDSAAATGTGDTAAATDGTVELHKVFHVDESAGVANEIESSESEEGDIVIETDHFSIYVLVDTTDASIKLTVEHWASVETINATNTTDPTMIYLDKEISSHNGNRYGYYTKDDVYDRHKEKINSINTEVAPIYSATEVSVSDGKKWDNIAELSGVCLAAADQNLSYGNEGYHVTKLYVTQNLDNAGKSISDWTDYIEYSVDEENWIGKDSSGNTIEGITLASNSLIRFEYVENEATSLVYEDVTFYDHNVSSGGATTGTSEGLNRNAFFSGTGSYYMGTGQRVSGNYSSWNGNYGSEGGYDTSVVVPGIGALNRGNRYDDTCVTVSTSNLFENDNKTHYAYPTIVQGIVEDDLTDDYGLQYNSLIKQPGFFAEKTYKSGSTTKYASKEFDNYQLGFKRQGDTYTLSQVRKNGTTTVLTKLDEIKYSARNGTSDTLIYSNEFWPLDTETNTSSAQYAGADLQRSGASDDGGTHNWHFGMRYDIEFKVGDYEGPMNFYFRGDDDFWLFVDGTLAIDLGGIHSAVGEAIDLRAWLDDHGGIDEDTTHRITIYYMERGGFGSCCYMQYTIPNCVSITDTTVPVTEVTVKKVWNDNSDENLKRPSSIQVQLYRSSDGGTTWQKYNNGTDTSAVTLQGFGDTWSHTWYNLPTEDVNDSSITYTYKVEEVSTLSGYTSSKSEDSSTGITTITNTLLTDINVEKNWESNKYGDSDQEDSVYVGLFKNIGTNSNPTWELVSESGLTNPVELNSNNSWSVTWSNLKYYDSSDGKIEYQVFETNSDGSTRYEAGDSILNEKYIVSYSTEVDNTSGMSSTTTVTNTYNYQKLYVKKVWVDYNNAYVTRPLRSDFKIQLYQGTDEYTGGLITLNKSTTEDNTWTGSWENVPIVSGTGDTYEYSIKELDGTGGAVEHDSTDPVTFSSNYDYTAEYEEGITGTESDPFKVTNTLVTAKLRVVKNVENPEGLEGEPIDSVYKFLIQVTEGDDTDPYTSLAYGDGENADQYILVIAPHDGTPYMIEEIVPAEYTVTDITGNYTGNSTEPGTFAYVDGDTSAGVTVKPGEDITVTITNTPSHDDYFHHTASVTNVKSFDSGTGGNFEQEDNYPTSGTTQSSLVSQLFVYREEQKYEIGEKEGGDELRG